MTSPATTLVLDPPCALINANQRLHHHERARLTRAWRQLATTTINNGWHPHHYTHAHITVHIRFPTNHRRDVGNYYPTAKAIVDGCVDAQLITDDNDDVITGPDMRRERPNGPLRVTVHIEPTEEH